MAKRSLYATPEGAKLARKVFDRRGWTQENLAAELDLRTRQPIWRFFTCRPIERHIFIEICTILDLNWWEIVAQAPEHLLNVEGKAPHLESEISPLVEQIRLKHQDRIEHQCGMLRISGTSFPVQLNDLYVEPRFLGRLISQEYLDIAVLKESCGSNLSNLREQQLNDSISTPLPVLENQAKLRILGKPGSGKTTFLQWVALQCSRGQFQPHLIPVFIKLSSYVEQTIQPTEFNLRHCVQQELIGCDVSDPQVIETLLNEGKFLILLDELNEISGYSNYSLILREISRFSELYYKNRIIVTSRLGSSSFELAHFTDLELVDFNDAQVASLAQKWFSVFGKPSEAVDQPNKQFTQTNARSRTESFLQQLCASGNYRIREIAGIPLLLNRICQTFDGKSKLSENRIRIYEECLSLYLIDRSREQNIQAGHSSWRITSFEQLYLLGRIATFALQRGSHFLEQRELEHFIETGICELHKEIEQKQILREEIVNQLRSSFLHQGILLEQARGVFSFSHIAFQEYLASRQIVSSFNLKHDLADLSGHLAEPHWREVIALVSSRLQDRNLLLSYIKLEVQSLVSHQPYIKTLLDELQQKSGKWLVYRQIAETHNLLYKIARTPDLLCRLATSITYMSVLAQKLLFEVVLAKLILWFAVPNWQNSQISILIQPLLDQAILLATTYQYQKLATSLADLREQLLCPNWASQGLWLECLERAVNDYASKFGNFRFNREQMQSLQLCLYTVQLLADLQGKSESDSLESLQLQLSELFSVFDFDNTTSTDEMPSFLSHHPSNSPFTLI
ncbi:MAG: NACHT domain-containing protein [Elainella sp. C42_A2020_010]|nr:NACHT domain-containing protein [Elainella sp. C42_A2020_010]